MTSGSREKYGELVVIGSENADLAAKLSKNRFELCQDEYPTAVMANRTQLLKKKEALEKLQSSNEAALSCEFDNDDKNVVVSFTNVDDKDMFQIGRAFSSRNHVQLTEVPTVSRYACRIVVDRNPPHTARIYAGAFDDKRRIFLGQNAIKHHSGDQFDALITNGVLLLHPPKPENGGVAAAALDDQWQPQWREVSVAGKLYKSKERRGMPNMEEDGVNDETNELIDGTIIDVGGVLLLWRSQEACKNFDDEALQKNVDQLNKMHNQCPVEMQTLILKQKTMANKLASANSAVAGSDPCALKLCGHVLSGQLLGTDLGGKCPVCRLDDPENVLIRLRLGNEPRLYVDNDLPTWFFKPCGHTASEKTVKYWSKVMLRSNGVDTNLACPFCLTALSTTSPISKLFFQ